MPMQVFVILLIYMWWLGSIVSFIPYIPFLFALLISNANEERLFQPDCVACG